jgi:hypothetical protein
MLSKVIIMELKEYFEASSGKGVLATANSDGEVDAAIYSKPHVMDDGTIAFIMRERLTYKNLQSNPHAAFLFIENGAHFNGIRIFLKKLKEDTDTELIKKLRRRTLLTPVADYAKGPKFLVYFKAEKILNLIGSGEPDINMP